MEQEHGPRVIDVLIVLIQQLVPILTALGALTAGLVAVIAAWRGQKKAVAMFGRAQGSADAALHIAEKTNCQVNSRVDSLLASVAAIRAQADESIAAARREATATAERAVIEAMLRAKRDAERALLEYRDDCEGGGEPDDPSAVH